MKNLFDQNAAKKPTNLSINSDLLKMAKECGINLSATLESALAEQVRAAKQRQWLQENQASIAAYNDHVEQNGVFSDGQRSF
ncbi:MAG TPA: type II toxin-antitoxin system CcdA family antitoxin [Spongiibacteraceae bacterium]|nr:type II toxin-antitoxin system CcdA family antitoxin [Spongiibacteraceae bacterium]